MHQDKPKKLKPVSEDRLKGLLADGWPEPPGVVHRIEFTNMGYECYVLVRTGKELVRDHGFYVTGGQWFWSMKPYGQTHAETQPARPWMPTSR